MKFKQYFKNLHFVSNIIRLFLIMEFKKNKTEGILPFLKSIKKGFFSKSAHLYNFKENDIKNYISDWIRLKKLSQLNINRRVMLDDKLIFHKMNLNKKIVLPVLAVIYDRKIYSYLNHNTTILNSEENLKNFVIECKEELIIKPINGGGGQNISKLSLTNGHLNFKGGCANYEDFKRKVLNSKRDFLFMQKINQDGICGAVHPLTLNTLRILTMIDPVKNEPFVAAAVQRFGTRESGVVDNWSAGGISVSVDIITGEMGDGASFPKQKGDSLIWTSIHPDTNIKFSGLKIPNWENILSDILNFAMKYHHLPYVGWDIVPMKDSYYILEGNTNSDVNLLQIHGGLLENDRNKNFFNYYKIIAS